MPPASLSPPPPPKPGDTAAHHPHPGSSVLTACPLHLYLLLISKCCQGHGPTPSGHLAPRQLASNAPRPLLQRVPASLESPAGSHCLFLHPLLWEEAQRSKAVRGPAVWAGVASCPLSRALIRRAQLPSVIPESSGLATPYGLLFWQRPNTRGLNSPAPAPPSPTPAGCAAVHLTPFFPAVGPTGLRLDPACEQDPPTLREASGPMEIRDVLQKTSKCTGVLKGDQSSAAVKMSCGTHAAFHQHVYHEKATKWN